MTILIRNGRVLDPKNNVDGQMDVLVKDGRILEVAPGIEATADRIIDGSGLWVAPGLIDLHVHLREPGYTHKEDIETGGKSGAAGGFTTICAMPNTKPVTDSPEIIRFIKEEAKAKSPINVLPIGSITLGQKGEELADFQAMADAGACAFSEDGFTVLSAGLLKKGLKAFQPLGLPMMSHCEDISLVDGGVINEGETAEKLGLPGISNDSEEVIVARDILLCDSTKSKLHLCHMSTKGSVQLIREAKARGCQVTAEASPHHFTLWDGDIPGNDANYKMNPPLRGQADLEAIREGLKDGTIDVIATDHAPHHEDEKSQGFEKGANGIVGLETALSLAITELVRKGLLTPMELIRKMSYNPAKVLGIDKGHLSKGAAGDITIIDPEAAYAIKVADFYSKGKNSPFDGRQVYGKAAYTIVAGKVVYENGEVRI